MQPVLYDYWRSSASYRVRIALNLKGIVHEREPVDLLAMAHKAPAHLARHPQGLVPALEIDGSILTQSVAIIEYLDETRPTPPLLPADPLGRHRVRALSYLIAMDIHPICNTGTVAHFAEVTGSGEQAKIDWMKHFIIRGLDALETMLGDPMTGRFCHGDTPTLADVCLVPQVFNARRWNVTVPPTVERIERHCIDLAPFAEAHPDRFAPAAG